MRYHIMMLFRIFLTVTLFLMACRGFVEAVEVFVVESMNIQPYDDALQGFRSSCGCNTREIVLSETRERDLIKEIHRSRPGLILAIGIDALSKVKGFKDIPIVYLMIPNPRSLLSGEENITGVSMRVSAERQLAKLKEVLPEVKRVGLVYDPHKTGPFIENALEASKGLGIRLVLKEVDSPKNVDSAIRGVAKDGIDVLWMVPDTTVVTGETEDSFFIFSLDNRIPILTFSQKLLEKGAVLSVGIDPQDMGRQAGEMVKRILSGTRVSDLPRVDARKVVLSLNLKTAKKLRITISDDVKEKAQGIIE
jgi:putative ABC transport system substrate-binding protein